LKILSTLPTAGKRQKMFNLSWICPLELRAAADDEASRRHAADVDEASPRRAVDVDEARPRRAAGDEASPRHAVVGDEASPRRAADVDEASPRRAVDADEALPDAVADDPALGDDDVALLPKTRLWMCHTRHWQNVVIARNTQRKSRRNVWLLCNRIPSCLSQPLAALRHTTSA